MEEKPFRMRVHRKSFAQNREALGQSRPAVRLPWSPVQKIAGMPTP